MSNYRPRLAVLVSHPIQYYAPLFRKLSERGNIDVRVFYSWGKGGGGATFDHGFGKVLGWDVPLLDGYSYEYLKNISKDPGVHHFKGIDNPGLVESISASRPDAILVFGWSFRSHLKVLRYFKKKIPVYFRGDSTFIDTPDNWKKIIRVVFLKWIYSHVDKAFYVGRNNYTYYTNTGMKPRQLVYAPHAIDNERFMQPDAAYHTRALEFRKELGIKDDDFVFLFAGKFEDKKDPLLLLNAFLRIGYDASVHLVIIGNGPLEATLKAAAAERSDIHFLDFQNQQQMPAIYRVADVFILPSKGPNETWGLAINEAMACSLPVIASDKCGGAPDLVENEVNGFIFEAGNGQDLERKMSVMLANRNKLLPMGSASLDKIQHFSYDNICQAIEQEMITDKNKAT